MNVLSLFDGISCGQQALKELGVPIENYYASEIDKHAIAITQYQYPNTIQLGDVTKWREWGIDWACIDLVQGGSPCQGFSFAGKQLNFNDPRSALFFVFADILEHTKKHNPNVKFLLENVRMKKEYQDVISQTLRVQPVMINSALVSAQNRVRLYWTNIGAIEQPEDRGILLRDVIEREPKIEIRDKSYCIDATYYKGTNWEQYKKKRRRQLVGNEMQWRKLTPLECERLQTLKDYYTAIGNYNGVEKQVSNTQRYRALGNGWTVEVIKHIYRGIIT